MAGEICNLAKTANSYIPPAMVVIGAVSALYDGYTKVGTVQDQFKAFVYTAALYGGASFFVNTVLKGAEPVACKL